MKSQSTENNGLSSGDVLKLKMLYNSIISKKTPSLDECRKLFFHGTTLNKQEKPLNDITSVNKTVKVYKQLKPIIKKVNSNKKGKKKELYINFSDETHTPVSENSDYQSHSNDDDINHY